MATRRHEDAKRDDDGTVGFASKPVLSWRYDSSAIRSSSRHPICHRLRHRRAGVPHDDRRRVDAGQRAAEARQVLGKEHRFTALGSRRRVIDEPHDARRIDRARARGGTRRHTRPCSGKRRASTRRRAWRRAAPDRCPTKSSPPRSATAIGSSPSICEKVCAPVRTVVPPHAQAAPSSTPARWRRGSRRAPRPAASSPAARDDDHGAAIDEDPVRSGARRLDVEHRPPAARRRSAGRARRSDSRPDAGARASWSIRASRSSWPPTTPFVSRTLGAVRSRTLDEAPGAKILATTSFVASVGGAARPRRDTGPAASGYEPGDFAQRRLGRLAGGGFSSARSSTRSSRISVGVRNRSDTPDANGLRSLTLP